MTARPGTFPLGLGTFRDGLLHIPTGYTPERAWPFAVLLHGAGRDGSEWTNAFTALDQLGIAAIAPDSRSQSWDIVYGSFGPDVEFIDRAMAFAFERCNVDPARLGMIGFSDGASCALSLGLGNGDFLTHIVAFSPGFATPAQQRGKPPIYITHGTQDPILPIDSTSRPIVAELRRQGYDVTYQEFEGGHQIPFALGSQVLAWFAGTG